MPHTLILGVGNLLMSDDGVGVHAVQRLEKQALPPSVEVLDGGTCGLDLLQYFEDVDRLIVLDAANLGCQPGTIVRLAGDEVPAFLAIKVSPHEINLPELLFSAKLSGIYPREVVVLGMQPETIDLGVELSPPVAAQVDALVEQALAEIGAPVVALA